MGTSKRSKNRKGSRNTQAKNRRAEELIADLHRQLGEFSLVIGAEFAKFRESSDRREQSVQGSVNQTIQGTQEAPKELQAASNIDGHTYAAGIARFVESGGNTGFRCTPGNKPDKI